MTLFSQAGSLNYASHTQPPESDLEKKMNATCGPKCAESFGRFNHVGLWAKTFSALLIGTGDWYSKRCKLTWKLKGTKYNRLYFQLQASTLPTKETGFGLLPTPTTQEPTSECEINENGRRMTTNGKDSHSLNIGRMAAMGLLLTPTTREEVVDLDKFKKRMEKYPNGTTMPNLATQVVGMLPTPKVGGKEGYETRAKRQGHDKAISHLEAFVEYQTGITSQQLNPQFVLELMGFPPNWTELPFLNGETNQSRPPETPLCPK